MALITPKAARGLTKILRSRPAAAVWRRRLRRKSRQRGVSLIEILVVLAIIGALVAVTAPSLDRYLDALTFNGKTQAIARDIARMRITALIERRMLFFPQTDDRGAPAYEGLSESLPDGWTIEGQPIVFYESGACTGGELTVIDSEGREARLSFDAPHCRFDSEP